MIATNVYFFSTLFFFQILTPNIGYHALRVLSVSQKSFIFQQEDCCSYHQSIIISSKKESSILSSTWISNELWFFSLHIDVFPNIVDHPLSKRKWYNHDLCSISILSLQLFFIYTSFSYSIIRFGSLIKFIIVPKWDFIHTYSVGCIDIDRFSLLCIPSLLLCKPRPASRFQDSMTNPLPSPSPMSLIHSMRNISSFHFFRLQAGSFLFLA
jgi:hypothetical protein